MLRALRFIIVLVVILSLGVQPAAVIPQSPAPRSNPSASSQPVLQFTSGNDVLGFQADGVYLASSSHVLHIAFLGANPVQPVSSQPALPGKSTQPLQQVSWKNLWDGISVIYQAAPGSIAESVYQLAAGAALDRIMMAYNRPVSLNADGSLTINFASGKITESAPLAWQEMDGKRSPVQIAFRLDGTGSSARVGFSASGINPAYPLTIDPSFQWLLFIGGSSNQNNDSIFVDWGGNVYLSGNASALPCSHSPSRKR